MKKLLTILMVGLLVFASVGTAFAEEPDLTSRTQLSLEQMQQMREAGQRYKALKEFKDEIHQINELRIERLELKTQQIEKNDSIIDLYISAREEGNKEALLEAREARKQIKEINKEISELHKQLKEERKAFREDVKNDNFDEAREHINKVISIKEQINSKVEAKLGLLDQIIEILS
ncbi:hypothetical protein [Caldisalinibacter kiritimatiensis]|uniref:Uncharacterized protein n=1 Tax=Caldisalinibacter kiritimatiensis TaxID=1304284 RepID=R1AU66_9FIRM|nr:hypothetical protein [Caldisalinibacter kiritimatiensis]EOD00217.1 hypothetical protein L21TH_1744 [Caldisalinibacter kiritimatiensis]